MKVVYSLRIDKELREEMKKYNVKWNEEIEKFIREKIEELKKEEAMKKLHEVISSLPETEPIGVRLVREDRDNN
jgi:PhoPQ-activated pathogenicity-related protein